MGQPIQLNTDIYCPFDRSMAGGRDDCDHVFPDTPNETTAEDATWICERCGRKVTYGVWQ